MKSFVVFLLFVSVVFGQQTYPLLTPCGIGQYLNQTVNQCVDCPRGYQCPKNSLAPVACDSGYYAVNPSAEMCSQCLAGSYCAGTGLTWPTNICQAGYYCPLGSVSATQTLCPSGSYCPQGSSTPVPCVMGSNLRCTFAGQASPCVPFGPVLFTHTDPLSGVTQTC